MTSIEKISFEEYKARPGINNSALCEFRRSPAHYAEYMKNGKTKSPAMGYGDVLHKLVFQPQEYLPRLATAPVKGRKTKKWAEAEKSNPDLLYVSESEKAQIVGMVGSIQQSKEVMDLLKGGVPEQSLFADHESTGLQMKGRLDFLCADGKTILDLKTTEDAREGPFERQVGKYGLHFQAAYYRKLAKLCGLTHTRFVFLALEKRPPYGLMLHELEVVSMGYAADKNEEALLKLKRCFDSNMFQCYEPGIRTITLPMQYIEMSEEDL